MSWWNAVQVQPGAGSEPAGSQGPPGVGIASATVNSSGHLILTKTDSSTIDAGLVVGPAGATGATGAAGAGSGGSPGPVNIYTASGAISPDDELAIIDSASACAMTLAAPTVDQHALTIKRFGAGAVTVTLPLDGASDVQITASSTSIKESIVLRADTARATWLAV